MLIYKVLFAIVGLRSYVPYMAVLLALHVVAAHLLWRITVRAGGDVRVATCVAAVFLVLGSGAENLDWAFQIGFVGALAAGLGMVLASLERTPRRLAAAWILGVVSLMFSGLGPIMVVAAGLMALLRFGWRRALATVITPGVVYLVWLLTRGATTSVTTAPARCAARHPGLHGHRHHLGRRGDDRTALAGRVLLLPLAWWVVAHLRRSPQVAAAVALAITERSCSSSLSASVVSVLGVAESR